MEIKNKDNQGTEEKTVKKSFRMKEQLHLKIIGKAAAENCSYTDIIITAINEYLGKDLNVYSQIGGAIESLRGDIKYLDKKVELGNSLFVFWLKYYFTFIKDNEELPIEERRAMMRTGEIRQKGLLGAFKTDMKKETGLIETLLADYLVEETK